VEEMSKEREVTEAFNPGRKSQSGFCSSEKEKVWGKVRSMEEQLTWDWSLSKA